MLTPLFRQAGKHATNMESSRIIKFRAWDIQSKEMDLDIEKWKDFSLYLSNPEMFHVMQYTGLKDKNGKEIYEGDIVTGTIEETFEDKIATGIIQIEPQFLMIDFPKQGTSIQFAMFDEDSIEVIGNIYKNPELLNLKE